MNEANSQSAGQPTDPSTNQSTKQSSNVAGICPSSEPTEQSTNPQIILPGIELNNEQNGGTSQ
jgi:hypothetical protein